MRCITTRSDRRLGRHGAGRWVAAAWLACVAPACLPVPAPQSSGGAADPCAQRPLCEPEACLSYVACNEPSPGDAEAAAVAGVIAQVQSVVRSTLTRVTVELDESGFRHYSDEFRRVFQQESSFEHRELVELGDRKKTASGYAVVAWLDRERALAVLGPAYEEVAGPFREAVASALAAGRVTDFSAAFCDARKRWVTVAARGAALAAVRGGPDPAWNDDRKAWQAVVRRAGALRALPIGIRTREGSAPQTAAMLVEMVSGGLAALGLVVGGEGDCDGGTVLTLGPVVTCEEWRLGVTCSLRVNVAVGPCTGDAVWRSVDLKDPSLKASSSWTEEDARARLWAEVAEWSKAQGRSQLADALACVYPLDYPLD